MDACSEEKTKKVVLEKQASLPTGCVEGILRFLPTLLFGAFFVGIWIWRTATTGSALLDGLVISAATISTLLVLNQHLPTQNLAGLVATIGVFWWATLLIAKISGVYFYPPFFNFHIIRENESGLFWVIGLINARGIAKLILHRWRKSANRGLWLIGLSSLLMTLEDSLARKHLPYFFQKFLFVLVIFVAATPWLINKKRVEEKPDYQPLLVTIFLWLW